MANSGIRWIQVILILGFIILQIILINNKQYTTAMIASVIYIPCAYFIKRFLFASSATAAIIHRQKLLKANTNDTILRDTSTSQSTESPIEEHTLYSALRKPGTTPIPGRRVQFTNIAPLKQNPGEMLSSVAQLARIGPVTITNREDIQIPLPILTENGPIMTPFQPVPRPQVRETPTPESIASDQERVRQRLNARFGEFKSRSSAFKRMERPTLPDFVPDPSKPQIW
ncbi:hypothetical protein EPVG_00370 [Emiliania huxleyi virus 201]|nr:hypothetical protein ELVG_00403 [Emiliania huxleyi virus 203]AEP15731.1 hypothetical protein EQVG_00321 [Emiliania huxleyi virus 207]AEP16264.1 hypothetical protein ERVG_00391 [Emiliania huxleyi virus 208]AET98257.1 hypothetical protein EPVG_00370 [Emiliania huxleyi virus 201]